jgi:hypothetical protein
MKGDKTKVWELYEAGKNFNNRLDPSYYDTVTTNSEMYNGNQWIYSNTSDELPRPVFNVINRIGSFFIASLTSNATKVSYSSMTDAQEGDVSKEVAIDVLNAEMANFYEKSKVNDKVRYLYQDGFTTGDMVIHMYLDADKKPYDGKLSKVEGDIDCECVDGVNFYLGNPNSNDIQSQPHVIITGRATVKELQEEYDKHNKDAFEVTTDGDTNNQIGQGNLIEIEDVDSLGKATYVLYYEKKKTKVKTVDEFGEEQTEEVEKVFVSKSIKDKMIYENVDLGITLYPVAFANWETQKNVYHGRAPVTSIVPNQIFINRMFSMAMYHLMAAAFPKLLYNKDKIGAISNKVGAAIGLKDLAPNENVSSFARYLEPGQMSNQIVQFIELVLATTKDMLGANNALLGSVNPEMASGTAITIAARQSGVPLENPKNNMYSLLEDVGRIFLDMTTNLYGERPVIMDVDGASQTVMFDFGTLKDIYLSTKVDVGATTYWNEIAMIQTLDNLLAAGHITFAQYLKRVPDDYVVDRDGLLREIEEALVQQTSPEAMIGQMSPEMQAQFQQLPPEEQQRLLAEFQQGA